MKTINFFCKAVLGVLMLTNLAFGQVTMFEDCDFRGNSRVFDVGRYNWNQLVLPNDVVSSLKVPTGYIVKLYDNANFRGESVSITTNTACLINQNFNDRMSSFEVCRISRTGRHTAFNPIIHGFKFANNFTVQTQIAGFNGPTFSGLCGGMVYAALDYYNAGMEIPEQDYMPAEGLPLQSYLYNRQLNSAFPNTDKWVEYGFNPFGSRNREFFNWGIQLGNGRLGELKSKIDRGEPVPLGLQACGGDCGCPRSCPGSHQVLAIGYEMGRYNGNLRDNIEDLSIYIYDPNFPNKTMILKANNAGAMYLYNEATGIRWRAYFTDMKYNAVSPPIIAKKPNELIATFKTGGDDLRGGNDNVHFSVILKSGEVIQFENINNKKRWVDWSNQPVSLSLPNINRIEDIAGVRLQTTFRGGWDGDNWNLDQLSIKVRLNGLEQELFNRSGTPLFRFTGDRQLKEFLF
jgi:hypothetical protein